MQIAKLAWLSRKDSAKAYGSIVVYITKAGDARRLLHEGFFFVGGRIRIYGGVRASDAAGNSAANSIIHGTSSLSQCRQNLQRATFYTLVQPGKLFRPCPAPQMCSEQLPILRWGWSRQETPRLSCSTHDGARSDTLRVPII